MVDKSINDYRVEVLENRFRAILVVNFYIFFKSFIIKLMFKYIPNKTNKKINK